MLHNELLSFVNSMHNIIKSEIKYKANRLSLFLYQVKSITVQPSMWDGRP